MKYFSSGRDYGSGSGEDDWTIDLEDIIEEQTRQQAGLDGGRRVSHDDSNVSSRRSAGEDDAYTGSHSSRNAGRFSSRASGSSRRRMDEDEDAVLFEEYDEDAEEDFCENDDETDSCDLGNREEDYDDRKGRGGRMKESRKERRAQRRDEKEYEEFLEYRKTRGREKKKRKHKFLRRMLVFLVVAILLIYALGTIALRLLGIQTSLTSIGSFNEGVAGNAAMSGYTNIALFGVDSRDEDLGEGNRTDVMIIASINNKNGDIRLVSVYRDTYVDIGDGNYQKANAAYAYGGASQAITMLNTNLDLNITDYVTIGFAGVADLIDTVGGVEIEVTEDEISHLNNYQSTMAEELGREYVEVTQTGTQTLNGLQAVAYCRIRYTDGGDFTRTERQREVLTQAFSKLKSSGPLTILRAAADLSDEIETSLSMAEIASLAMKVFTYSIEETSGFPSDDMVTTGYIGDASCVIPITLATNVVWLHEYLFDDTDYTVSDTVQTISDYISAVTGYY